MKVQNNSIEKYAKLETICDGVPIYGFGSTFVYGLNPNYIEDVIYQDDNENKMGSTTTRGPRTVKNDDQLWLPVWLLDGNPNTCWCSHGQIKANIKDEWIRIDLPKEQLIKKITLVTSVKGIPDDTVSHIGIWSGVPGRFGQVVPRP